MSGKVSGNTLPARLEGTKLQVQGQAQPSLDRISDLVCRELIGKAMEMRKMAYAPYSHFSVGAALLSKGNKIFGGCNIENAAYSPSNCAERTAFFKAVSEGVREFAAIAIVGGGEEGIREFCPPCGVCRQVMMEFCDPKTFCVILARSVDDYWIYTLEELLPMGFGPGNL